MQKILMQIDSDIQPSAFDSIVAVDSGVESLLRFGNVKTTEVVALIHGGLFTRHPKSLCNTAAFFGGSNVEEAEAIYQTAKKACFGPMKISMMFDPNGANTTASAAVLRCEEHSELENKTAIVFGGTGPVGSRIASLLAKKGARVILGSRKLTRAQSIAMKINSLNGNSLVSAVQIDAGCQEKLLENTQLVFAAGAAGVEFLDAAWLESNNQISVAIDVNAVPPVGLGGIEVSDCGTQRHSTICFGAIGVGGLKMKIHKASIKKLFETNDQFLDTWEIYELGKQLSSV